jgi:GINS complex subunit 2
MFIKKGDTPVFQPPRSVEVPLWMAIALKRRGLCLIKPPTWLNTGKWFSTYFSF